MSTVSAGRYHIDNMDSVFTPCVAIFPDLIEANIRAAIGMVPSADRLRPHCKTHKTIELAQLALRLGITKHKCATFAEAEMLVQAGASDIVFAYSLVGPNIQRFLHLLKEYPEATFRPLVDHPRPMEALSQAVAAAGKQVEVILDLDVGMGRTGMPIGPAATACYQQIAHLPGLTPAGLHVYDGQSHQTDASDRAQAVDAVWSIVRNFANELEASGLPVPRIICGNSPTFGRWSQLAATDPRIECSPGTFFLNDANYSGNFPDLPFQPAAVLLTRVVSKPRPGRLTLDLGYKAVSADSQPPKRARLLGLSDYTYVLQNEEHLVIDTPDADRFEPGDVLYALPGHVCPTCALHKELLVVRNHRVCESWRVVARDRQITC